MAGITFSLPKRVQFHNRRIQKLYLLVGLATFVVYIWNLFNSEKSYKEVPMHPRISANLWNKQLPEAEFLAIYSHKKSTSPLCNWSGEYDFWWDEFWKYENYTCDPICGDDRSSNDCTSTFDMSKREAIDQIYYFASFTSYIFAANGTESHHHARLYPAVTALQVSLSYNYEVPSNPFFGRLQEVGRDGSNDGKTITLHRHRGTDNADEKLQFYRMDNPGKQISYNLSELLFLSGVDHFLDQTHSGSGANIKPGAKHNGPLGWITGIELVMSLDCSNFVRGNIHLPESVHKQLRESAGRFCFITVSKTARKWASMDRVDTVSIHGGMSTRHYAGIKIFVQRGGKYRFRTFEFVFNSLVSGLVLAQIPEIIVGMIALFCLGRLSKIYRRAVYSSFHIIDATASLVTRVMSQGVVFSEISDSSGSITKTNMQKRLRLVMNNPKYDEELKDVCDAAFSKPCPPSHRLWDSVFRECGCRRKSFARVPADNILLDRFSMITGETELTLEDALRFFSRNRSLGIFEHFFSPMFIRRRKHHTTLFGDLINMMGDDSAAPHVSRGVTADLEEKQFEERRAEILNSTVLVNELVDSYTALRKRMDTQTVAINEMERRMGELATMVHSAHREQAVMSDSYRAMMKVRDPPPSKEDREAAIRRVQMIHEEAERSGSSYFEDRCDEPLQPAVGSPDVPGAQSKDPETFLQQTSNGLPDVSEYARQLSSLEARMEAHVSRLETYCETRMQAFESRLNSGGRLPTGDLQILEARVQDLEHLLAPTATSNGFAASRHSAEERRNKSVHEEHLQPINFTTFLRHRGDAAGSSSSNGVAAASLGASVNEEHRPLVYNGSVGPSVKPTLSSQLRSVTLSGHEPDEPVQASESQAESSAQRAHKADPGGVETSWWKAALDDPSTSPPVQSVPRKIFNI